MRFFIHHFDPLITFITPVSFASTHIKVFLILSCSNSFITKRAWLWLGSANFIMIAIFALDSFKGTILALNMLMFLRFMIFFISFRHAHPTIFALVILARTPYIVHSKFFNWNLLFTKRTFFSFTFHFKYF